MFKYKILLALFAVHTSFALAAETLRDPTRPLQEIVTVPQPAPTFQLHSILISQQRRVAIINGKTVAEGESVEGAKVLRIQPHRVSLLHRGKALELRLHSSTIRRDAANHEATVKHE